MEDELSWRWECPSCSMLHPLGTFNCTRCGVQNPACVRNNCKFHRTIQKFQTSFTEMWRCEACKISNSASMRPRCQWCCTIRPTFKELEFISSSLLDFGDYEDLDLSDKRQEKETDRPMETEDGLESTLPTDFGMSQPDDSINQYINGITTSYTIGTPTPKPITEKEKAIEELKNLQDTARKLQKNIIVNPKKELLEVKQFLVKGNKEGLRFFMMKNRLRDVLLSKTEQHLRSVDEICKLDLAKIEITALQGLKAENTQLTKDLDNLLSISAKEWSFFEVFNDIRLELEELFCKYLTILTPNGVENVEKEVEDLARSHEMPPQNDVLTKTPDEMPGSNVDLPVSEDNGDIPENTVENSENTSDLISTDADPDTEKDYNDLENLEQEHANQTDEDLKELIVEGSPNPVDKPELTAQNCSTGLDQLQITPNAPDLQSSVENELQNINDEVEMDQESDPKISEKLTGPNYDFALLASTNQMPGMNFGYNQQTASNQLQNPIQSQSQNPSFPSPSTSTVFQFHGSSAPPTINQCLQTQNQTQARNLIFPTPYSLQNNILRFGSSSSQTQSSLFNTQAGTGTQQYNMGIPQPQVLPLSFQTPPNAYAEAAIKFQSQNNQNSRTRQGRKFKHGIRRLGPR